jgi:F-box-like
VTIGVLPDEILLKIFDFCRVAAVNEAHVAVWLRVPVWSKIWHNLVHVCQRWRYVVFSSPLRLGLRIYCTDDTVTSLREELDVWPPFPIEILSSNLGDNSIAAFEHNDRICEITLYFHPPYSECATLATALQKPFPALTSFQLSTHWNENLPVLPTTFLGGFAPRLQLLALSGVPFPTLPQLLSSCNDLSELKLRDIPDIGYIPPESMAIALSTLPRLTYLCIEFEKTGAIRLGHPPPTSLTRAILPALTEFKFRGVSGYLEDLLARIDAPQLKDLAIMFKQRPIDIRLGQVVSHSQTFGPFRRVDVAFMPYGVNIRLWVEERPQRDSLNLKPFKLEIIEAAPTRQVSFTAQICTQFSSLLSSVTRLNIGSDKSFLAFGDSGFERLMDNTEWLVLVRPFTAVRTLHMYGKVQLFMVSALRGHAGESVGAVLPKLHNLYAPKFYCDFRDVPVEQAIERFITARQHSGRPVTVHQPEYYVAISVS